MFSIQPHTWKSSGLRSGDHGGQLFGLPRRGFDNCTFNEDGEGGAPLRW